MRYGLMVSLLMVPAMAVAQTDAPPAIQVSGIGKVSTPPDIANLIYWVSGEGRTADEASAALAAKQKAISNGLISVLGRDAELSSGQVSIIETRSPQCEGSGYNGQPHLSEGPCAVTGAIANLQGQVRTRAVAKAATAAGLAARLGAKDARVQGFELSDLASAQRRATAAALRDALARAQTLAAGAGVKLGPVLQVSDQSNGYTDIMVTGTSMSLPPAPPPPPPPPPVEIDIKPRPIETQMQVYVRYAIDR